MDINEQRLKAMLEALEVPNLAWWMNRHPEVIRVLVQHTVALAKREYRSKTLVDDLKEVLEKYEPEFLEKYLKDGKCIG